MADVINLNKARKARDKAQAQAKAAENRVRFGRTKEQKSREAGESAMAQHKLDLLQRQSGDSPTHDGTDDEGLT